MTPEEKRYEDVGHLLALLEELREAQKTLYRSVTRATFFVLKRHPKGPGYATDIESILEMIDRIADRLDTQIQVEARPPSEEDGIDLLELEKLRPDKPA